MAFNPGTQEYLVAWHLSAPSLQGGAHVIIGQRVYGHASVTKGNAFILVKGKMKTGDHSMMEPKLMYNEGSGE